jgi:hypothetical protein
VDALPSGLGATLVGSEWDFAEQCRALKDSKAYWQTTARDEDADGLMREAPEGQERPAAYASQTRPARRNRTGRRPAPNRPGSSGRPPSRSAIWDTEYAPVPVSPISLNGTAW